MRQSPAFGGGRGCDESNPTEMVLGEAKGVCLPAPGCDVTGSVSPCTPQDMCRGPWAQLGDCGSW